MLLSLSITQQTPAAAIAAPSSAVAPQQPTAEKVCLLPLYYFLGIL